MKTIITIFIAFLILIPSFAQQGINYKAVIKDGSGNIVAGQTINVKFLIIEDTGSTVVYAENHTNVMTDANGIIILNIGEGTPTTNTFASIAWGSDTHSLKTEIDIERDGSFVKFLETPFKTVPYALNAANVSGLEKITESINPSTGLPIYGWRLIGAIPANYGSIGENAVDLSNSGGESTEQGATGLISNAFGLGTIASGIVSTAMGNYTLASGQSSTAMGFGATASGDYATSMGRNTKATGNVSTAIGYGSEASGHISTSAGYFTDSESFSSFAIGRYNIGGGFAGIPNNHVSSSNWIATDPLFEIGNGSSDSNRNNALTVLKNGTITAPALTNALINTAGNKALVTKEYVDANNVASINDLTDGLSDSNNVGLGVSALNGNTSGTDNTAVGRDALFSNSSGKQNTSVGRSALWNNTTGSNNIAIGYSTPIPNAMGSNQVRIGNNQITSAGIQVAWTVTSDKRWKDNIRELPYGLDMVMQLQPVDYTRKNNNIKTREMGFIAQDLEALLAKVGYIDQGFLTKDDDGFMSVRYNDLIALLTKAIQEQQSTINAQNSKIDAQALENTQQNANIDSLLQRMTALEVVNNQ